MKPIELTEEHKSKLLEMCKELFIESKPKIDSNNIVSLWILDSEGLSEGEYNFKIHWFEFCMTYLMYKLSYEFSKIPNIKGRSIHIELWELNKGDYFKKHPVDYLYEEFKKLKL